MASSLNVTQYNVLISVACISSGLSILGSSCIGIIASKKLDQFFHRLVFGLSIADIVVSVACFLQPFLLRPITDDPLYHLAIGNTATCSFLGFLMRFPAAVSIYNCYLSIYFNYSVRRKSISRCEETSTTSFLTLEWAAHCIAFGSPVLFGTIGLVTESFNPLPLLHICDTGPYPPGCDNDVNNNNNEADDKVCTRGGEFYLTLDWCYLAALLIPSAIGLYNTISLYVFVKRQSETTKRLYSFRESAAAAVAARRQQRRRPTTTEPRPTTADHHQQLDGSGSISNSNNNSKYSTVRQVAHQSILYTLAYLNGTSWAFATRVLFDRVNDIQGRDHEPKYYVFVLLTYAFFPLQGFWNSYIYIRPRYRIWKRFHPEKSFWFVATKILNAEEPVVRRKSMRRRRRSSIRGVGGAAGTSDMGWDISQRFQQSLDSFSMAFSRTTRGKEHDRSGSVAGKSKSINSNGSVSVTSNHNPIMTTTTTTIGGGSGNGLTSGYLSPPKSMELSSSTPSGLDEATSTNEIEEEKTRSGEENQESRSANNKKDDEEDVERQVVGTSIKKDGPFVENAGDGDDDQGSTNSVVVSFDETLHIRLEANGVVGHNGGNVLEQYSTSCSEESSYHDVNSVEIGYEEDYADSTECLTEEVVGGSFLQRLHTRTRAEEEWESYSSDMAYDA